MFKKNPKFRRRLMENCLVFFFSILAKYRMDVFDNRLNFRPPPDYHKGNKSVSTQQKQNLPIGIFLVLHLLLRKMAHNYLQPVHNHFDDKFDDVDDDLFLQNKRTGTPKVPQPRSTNPFEIEDDEEEAACSPSMTAEQLAYAERRRAIEQRTLDSTNKSLSLLYETQEVGKATAVELAKQREQLEKTSHQLDEINATLRFSQRHLNGLKSVFGGLKNYLSGNRDQPPSATASPTASQSSQEANSNINEGACGGVASPAPYSPTDPYDNHPVSRLRGDPSSTYQSQAQASNPFQAQIDANLEEMCGNLSDLKLLALDLGSEIESQNELIDNMNYKIEDVDLKMNKQNKDMSKLLKK